MKLFDRRSEFTDGRQWICLVAGIVGLWHIEECGPVAPVVGVGCSRKILHWHQVNSRDSQIFQVVYAGSTTVTRRTAMRKPAVCTANFRRAGLVSDGEVTNMNFVKHLVSGTRRDWYRSGVPVRRFESIQINNDRSCGIRCGSKRVNIWNDGGVTVMRKSIGISLAVQIPGDGCLPYSVRAAGKLNGRARLRLLCLVIDEKLNFC